MTPLELLKAHLANFEKNMRKSQDAFIKGKISLDDHMTHLKNNYPKVEAYIEAIVVLTNYYKSKL